HYHRRRFAYPAAAITRSRPALGWTRRLLCGTAYTTRGLIGGFDADWPFSGPSLSCGSLVGGRTRGRRQTLSDAGFGGGAGQALCAHRAPCISQRCRRTQLTSPVSLAVWLDQNRPPADRAAGIAHR